MSYAKYIIYIISYIFKCQTTEKNNNFVKINLAPILQRRI